MSEITTKQPLCSDQAGTLFSYPKYWAECYGTAPYLPMSRAEMDRLGWDSCDIIIVTGDAYVDHPSFGAALIGRWQISSEFAESASGMPEVWSARIRRRPKKRSPSSTP